MLLHSFCEALQWNCFNHNTTTMPPRRMFSERIMMVNLYIMFGSYEAMVENWPDDRVPSKRTVLDTVARFNQTGSVEDLPHPGRTRTTTDQVSLTRIEGSVREIPQMSIRQRAQNLHMSCHTLRSGGGWLCLESMDTGLNMCKN
jgi:hypothetical protein